MGSNEMEDSEDYDEEEDSDEEDCKVISFHKLQNVYQMKIKEDEYESKNIRYFIISVKDQLGQQVGAMKAFLVDRGDWNRIYFWTECDSINQETCDIATKFTNPEGRLLYDKIEGLDRETDKGASSKGGFLFIDTMTLKMSERGHDLSLDMVDKLFDYLDGRWTIAWIAPFPDTRGIMYYETDDESEDTSNSFSVTVDVDNDESEDKINHTPRKRRIENDDTEDAINPFPKKLKIDNEDTEDAINPFPEAVGIENDESEDEDALNKANVALARHFARLGFIQASVNKHQSPDFWYLIPSRRTRKSKASVANYPVIQEEKLSLADTNNDLVKAVLGPEIEMVDKVKKLVNSGMDIDQSEALFFAISNERNADIIKKLLELGANVNYKIKSGDTLLHLAAGKGNLKICEMLLHAGAQKEATNDEGDTPFHVAVKNIENENKFLRTFHINPTKEARRSENSDKLNILHLLILDPSQLLGGILTPRMFFRLKTTAEVAGDICMDSIEDEHFQNRVPIDRETARCSIFLLGYVPYQEIPEDVFKSYAMGWQQQLAAIGRVMSRGDLPVQALVDQEMSSMDWRYYSHYRERGGSLLHGLHAVMEYAREESLSIGFNGCGSFEEIHGEKLEKLPAMKILDDDFLFVERFLFSYCVGLI